MGTVLARVLVLTVSTGATLYCGASSRALAPAPSVTGDCANCSLATQICVSGACVCGPGWAGANCSQDLTQELPIGGDHVCTEEQLEHDYFVYAVALQATDRGLQIQISAQDSAGLPLFTPTLWISTGAFW
eukprot:gnl/Hemi2/22365_TR7449_c0_g1_i1.p1 gnl/Hemi2/22365_TR7449_c0_g1~~gnl/Hemi2/22365_TR7449_c0_g1_i1.p1  ORF type:complete len:131 (-),score=14.06 gnl/Hemi2/22365_TR7449_c0_g1_i1:215-607(-)